MHTVGYCRQGRPIIYSCLALASNRDFEENKAHMIQTFEMVGGDMGVGGKWESALPLSQEPEVRHCDVGGQADGWVGGLGNGVKQGPAVA